MSSILKALEKLERDKGDSHNAPPREPQGTPPPGRRVGLRSVLVALALGSLAGLAGAVWWTGTEQAGSSVGPAASPPARSTNAPLAASPPARSTNAPLAASPPARSTNAPAASGPDPTARAAPEPPPAATARAAPEPPPAATTTAAPKPAAAAAPREAPQPAPAPPAAKPQPRTAPAPPAAKPQHRTAPAPPAAKPVPRPAPAPPPAAKPESRTVARAKPVPPPEPPAPAVAEVPALPVPDLIVATTTWHPDPTLRSARIELQGRADPVELRHGDAVGPLVVHEIQPSAVVFRLGEVEVVRRVGQRPPN